MAMPTSPPRRRPQRPTHPTGGGPPVFTGGSPPRPSRLNRRAAVDRAIAAVRSALMSHGSTAADAGHLARVLLSRDGVTIGAGKAGNILYQGQRYTPDAFATSDLAKMATGARAAELNKAAITGDPGYIQALANLGLGRDQSIAGLDDQQRQALIEFGDPSFATGDPLTAGAAAANPFGTSQLLAKQLLDQRSLAAQAANRAGTTFGGGFTSGQNEAQRQFSAQNQDAVTKLQALLSQIGTQRSLAGQTYNVGQQQAYLDAYNALLSSGAIHAAQPPNWGVGTFAVRGYGPGGGGGRGRAGGQVGPQPGPGRVGQPTRTTFPVRFPTMPGQTPPIVPPRGPTQTTFPTPNPADYWRRYGVM